MEAIEAQPGVEPARYFVDVVISKPRPRRIVPERVATPPAMNDFRIDEHFLVRQCVRLRADSADTGVPSKRTDSTSTIR